jgi:DNA-binding PadR family transcriptional regulator
MDHALYAMTRIGYAKPMASGRASDAQTVSMQSPVNWALLGLVIERPSYAYELAQRFERTYDGVLSLSSISHAYTALGALKGKALIEEIAGTREGRQPKPLYRATQLGLDAYRGWLVSQAEEDARRGRLFVLQLFALSGDPDAALETIDRYEQTCLREIGRTPIAGQGDAGADGTAGLLARLLAEEGRLTSGTRLAWIEFARQELKALAQRRGDRQ